MSDEQRELGREAGTGSWTDQHSFPSYSTATPPNPEAGTPYARAYPGSVHPGAPYPGASHGDATRGTAHLPIGGYGTGPATAAERPRKQRAMTGIVAAALLAGLVGGGAGFGGAYVLLDGGRAASPALTTVPSASNVGNTVPGSVSAAAQTAMPSAVDIRVSLSQGTAEGSGVILTADGNVLTNNHVVAGGGGDITVTLADGSEHPATLVGTAPSYDLAVLKLTDVSGLTPATLGNSADLQVGQPVVAIGSPQGLSGTVTTGIVSAFDRTVQVQGEDGTGVVYNGLQTDAPINQGNSGGPLVNLQGQVVGINSAIATAGQSSGSIGLGFAIPIDQAKRVAEEIMESGSATKPVLGVRGNATASGGSGAQLAEVDAESPAGQAGLKTGDVVTKVGDARVQDFADLIARIGSHAPGDTVTLTVGSGGAERAVDVTLGSTPDRGASTSNGGQSQNPFGGGNPFGIPPR